MNGNNLTITCIILDPKAVIELEYAFNGQKVTEDTNHKVVKFRNGKDNCKNLTIINASKNRDEGYYSCIAVDHVHTNESVSKFLKFFTKPEVVFNETEIDIMASSKRVTFIIYYRAYPSAFFYIFDSNNTLILVGTTVMNMAKYDIKIYLDRVELAIKRPEIEDHGNYTFVATCAGENYTMTANLIANSKPVVAVVNVITFASREIQMNCYAYGYPKPEISWGEFVISK